VSPVGSPSPVGLVERSCCPVCGEERVRTLYRAAFDKGPIRDYLVAFYPALPPEDLGLLKGGELVLEECPSCSLIWQRFVPTPFLLDRLYGTWVGDTGFVTHDDVAYQAATAEEVLLALRLAGKPPSEVSVLDFGMGWGRWPRIAAAMGCAAFGVEPSEPAADHARRHGVTVLGLDELPDETFDFVNCEQVFEHLVEPVETLTRLARALGARGWLKIAVPSGKGVAERLRSPDWEAGKGSAESLNAVAPLEHVNCFSSRSLEVLGERAGLEPARPKATALYSATVGLWPPRALLRGLARPPIRRFVPGAAFFRRRA